MHSELDVQTTTIVSHFSACAHCTLLSTGYEATVHRRPDVSTRSVVDLAIHAVGVAFVERAEQHEQPR